MPVGKGDLEAGLPDFKDQVRSVAAHAQGAVAKKPHKLLGFQRSKIKHRAAKSQLRFQRSKIKSEAIAMQRRL